MSLQKLECIIPFVFPEAPYCPDALIMQHAITAARRFFTQTQAWTCEHDKILVRAGIQDYSLDHPSHAIINTVKSVFLDGIELFPFSGYSLNSKCEIRLTTAPASDTAADADGLEVELVLVPLREAKTAVVPLDLWESWHEAFARGALSTLLAIRGQPWSNPERAKELRIAFIEDMNAATIDQNRAGMNADLTATVTPDHEFV